MREAAKLIPVYGQTAGTAAAMATSFVTSWALGKAAVYFLADGRYRRDDLDLAAIYARELKAATRLFREREGK